jgi:hypothetical protein
MAAVTRNINFLRFMWSLFCPSELKNSMTLFGIDEIVQDYKKKVL